MYPRKTPPMKNENWEAIKVISTLYLSAADAVNKPIGVTRPDMMKVANRHTASMRNLFIILWSPVMEKIYNNLLKKLKTIRH